jgi:hypothetical protein
MAECAEADCSEPASVRLHIPWAQNRVVCSAHARVLGQRDGVVPDPIANDEEWS